MAVVAGGVILGSALGTLFDILLDVEVKNRMFSSLLGDIQSTLLSLEPLMKEIAESNREFDRSKEEHMRNVLQKGAKLVGKCAKTTQWNVWKKYKYCKKLLDFEKSLTKLLSMLSLLIIGDGQQTLVKVNNIGEGVEQIKQRAAELEKKESTVVVAQNQIDQIEGWNAVPEPPSVTDGLDVPLRELKKEDCLSMLVVTALQALTDNNTQDGEVKGMIYSPSDSSNGNVEVHPLPLPPGANMPSPQALLTPKPESQPMIGQWKKGKCIGRGAFGSVYVATNRETGAVCAIKEAVLFPGYPKSADCENHLQQEINVLSQLKHPNIVQYYGSERVGDRFYIYMEYIHHGSIKKYIHDRCGAITESVVQNFTHHILLGLDYLHGKKTLHRDIKGDNLLVDSCGVVKLADFGVAKHLAELVGKLSLKGSPYWMAPELIRAVMYKDNNCHLALAVDIWSLGCTIIEMFTGKAPWSEYEAQAAMFKMVTEYPPIPETLSPEGKDFLRCCFQKNPAERPTATILLAHPFLTNSQHPGI